jgi:hypothetical protein
MDFSFTFKKKPEGQGPKPPPVNHAQTQYDALRGCGINLRGHTKLSEVTKGADPAGFEDPPFVQLLCCMGGMNDQGQAWSEEVFLWPAGCVGESGVLTALVSRVAGLCRGALAVEEVEDTLNAESGLATVAFTLDGERVEWEVPVQEGEADPQLIAGLAGIAAERGEGARLACAEVEGVGRLLVFMTEPEIAELAETTGLAWAVVA